MMLSVSGWVAEGGEDVFGFGGQEWSGGDPVALRLMVTSGRPRSSRTILAMHSAGAS